MKNDASLKDTVLKTAASMGVGAAIAGTGGAIIGGTIGASTFGPGRAGDGAFHIPGNIIAGAIGAGIGGAIGVGVGAAVGGAASMVRAEDAANSICETAGTGYRFSSDEFNNTMLPAVISVTITSILINAAAKEFTPSKGNHSIPPMPPMPPVKAIEIKKEAENAETKFDKIISNSLEAKKIKHIGHKAMEKYLQDLNSNIEQKDIDNLALKLDKVIASLPQARQLKSAAERVIKTSAECLNNGISLSQERSR